MLDSITRPLKEKVLIPSAKFVGRYASPNALTIAAFLVGVGAGAVIYLGNIYVALSLWILNRIIDGYDGTVARITNRQSDFGGYLDILLDFVIYALIPVMFTITYASTTAGWIILTILLSIFYINSASWMFLSAVIEKRQHSYGHKSMTTIRMPSGLVEGTETVIIYSLFFIFPQYVIWLFVFLAVTTTVGIVQRIVWAFSHLKRVFSEAEIQKRETATDAAELL